MQGFGTAEGVIELIRRAELDITASDGAKRSADTLSSMQLFGNVHRV